MFEKKQEGQCGWSRVIREESGRGRYPGGEEAVQTKRTSTCTCSEMGAIQGVMQTCAVNGVIIKNRPLGCAVENGQCRGKGEGWVSVGRGKRASGGTGRWGQQWVKRVECLVSAEDTEYIFTQEEGKMTWVR